MEVGALLWGESPEAVQDAEALGGGPLRVAAATDAVPARWVQLLAGAGELSVPGEFSRAALVRSGVDADRIRVVAPAVDATFSPSAPVTPIKGARGFVFLALVDWTRASGWDVLARAFAAEFEAHEDVSLVLRAWSTLEYTPAVAGEMLIAELEAAGHDLDALPDLIFEAGREHARPSASDYLAADCFVSPARGDAWGRRLAEAAACGLPVIATAWAAGAELPVSHPVGGRVVEVDDAAARELPHLAGGRWLEPDADALRRQMRAAFERRPAPPLAVVPVAGERVVRHPQPGARPEEVSFVLQGPVEPHGRGSTAAACRAIRNHFPGAEIVVSTWEGADASGLDCDVVVQSADPGGIGGPSFNANLNRQTVSSLAGIRAASRPLVVKARTDIQFVSNALLDHWGRWEERADELRFLEQRVLIPNVFTRRPSYLAPFPIHPTDWSYFGTRADLETLFDAPLMRCDESFAPPTQGIGRLYWWKEEPPSYTPEQWYWLHALRSAAPDLSLKHIWDLTPETLRATELSFANNLVVLDTYAQYGLWCPKYPGANRVFEDYTLYQHADWLELYHRHVTHGPEATDVDGLLEQLAGGETVGHEDAAALRRAGHPWIAQLAECVLRLPGFRRDATTGGYARWQFDLDVLELAREELPRAAAAALNNRAPLPSTRV
jgi:hypothetical protein